MKLRDEGEPQDDGFYALRRSVVLEVLARHFVTISREREAEDLYLLERDDFFIYINFPLLIQSPMIFRLAHTFSIPIEEFYQASRDSTH